MHANTGYTLHAKFCMHKLYSHVEILHIHTWTQAITVCCSSVHAQFTGIILGDITCHYALGFCTHTHFTGIISSNILGVHAHTNQFDSGTLLMIL